jgi:hypothetical protein
MLVVGACWLTGAPRVRTQAPSPAIPAHNRADLATPPPLPGPGQVAVHARRLLEAIVRDDPGAVADVFLPREAFRLVKGVTDPDPLYDRLLRAYERDIHALHAQVPAGAEFVRFEFSRRRGWVQVREEANRLPYWAQRHSQLVYRVGAEERRIEVRTMIAWDERWYITHLSEFH